MRKAATLFLVCLAVLSTVAMAPESDSDSPLEIVITDGIRWFRTVEPVDPAPSGYYPGTMYLSKDPDDPLMKAYLDGEITKDALVEGQQVEGPCYVFCYESQMGNVPGNPEFMEMESPPVAYLYMAEGTCSFAPSVQTSGRFMILGDGVSSVSFSEVNVWKDGTYELRLRDCPYHCMRFTLVSGDARILPHASGTVAHEMCTAKRWLRGTYDIEPGKYIFHCYTFPDGSEEDTRFRTEVAEEFSIDVPDWAKSTWRTLIMVEKTTKMAFYSLESSDSMSVAYNPDGRSGSMSYIRPAESEVIRPDLPEHLYLFAPANEHVSFVLTYDMSCCWVKMSLPDGKQLIASDSEYDMVFSESTIMDFTVEWTMFGFNQLPLSTTVFLSYEGAPDPDRMSAPAIALCILAFATVVIALAFARLKGRRKDTLG